MDDYNVLQPDILYLANDKKAIVTHDGIMGAPNLVIEIISPGTAKWDRGGKMRVYEQFGVAEYWIVEVRMRSVEVYVTRFSERRFDFDLNEVYLADERNPNSPVLVRSEVLSELALHLDIIFAGV